jgi:hypothetical protein
VSTLLQLCRNPVTWAAVLAVAAVLLRLSLADFPTDVHIDEAIIAGLAQRTVDAGRLSANWDGFPEAWWSRPTYQFSPYTLAQTAVHWLLNRCLGWPATLDEHVRCARLTSCACAGLAVFLLFFVTRRLFASTAAGLLAQAVLALSLLNIQDSIYARVDALIGLLVVACLGATALAITTNRYRLWGGAAALLAGVTLSAKYNTVPVLLLVAFVPVHQVFVGKEGWGRACGTAALGLVGVAVGFLAATPEVLWDPAPLYEGWKHEYDHYTEGHVPHQAFDFWDNNLFYYADYLSRLGVGWFPCLFALLFFGLGLARRTAPYLLVGSYLLVAFGLVLVTLVRFERNLEMLLVPLAVAAGVAAAVCLDRVRATAGARAALAATVVLLVLSFAQPLQTIVRFSAALRPEASPWQHLDAVGVRDKSVVRMLLQTESPQLREHREILLLDYGDAFSRTGLARWRRALGDHEYLVLSTPWSEYGYPFSTIDMYHGPARIHVLRPIQQPAHGGATVPGSAP